MEAEKTKTKAMGTAKDLYDSTAKTVTQVLNRAETLKLFAAESILIDESDAVPESKVIELFGEKAANFVKKSETAGVHYNFYGIGNYVFPYFTFEGFEQAVTFSNIQKICESEEKHI